MKGQEAAKGESMATRTKHISWGLIFLALLSCIYIIPAKSGRDSGGAGLLRDRHRVFDNGSPLPGSFPLLGAMFLSGLFQINDIEPAMQMTPTGFRPARGKEQGSPRRS